MMTSRDIDLIWFLLFDASSQAGGGEHTVNFACGRAGRDEPLTSHGNQKSSSGGHGSRRVGREKRMR